MQEKQPIRRSTGAKALALDERASVVRYRFQLLALVLSAAFALGLHLVFGR